MVDHVSPSRRSQIMVAVKGKNTQPELIIRSLMHRAGYRYRLHDKTLPGSPDLVLKKYKAIIYVHGCFWHGHNCVLSSGLPKTNTAFWKSKINKNKRRDLQNVQDLCASGWRICIVWECALKRKDRLDTRIIIKQIAKWLKAKDTFIEIQGTHNIH